MNKIPCPFDLIRFIYKILNGRSKLVVRLHPLFTDKSAENELELHKELDKNIETVFVTPPNNLLHISSSIVRDVWKNGGDISKFIPEGMRL